MLMFSSLRAARRHFADIMMRHERGAATRAAAERLMLPERARRSCLLPIFSDDADFRERYGLICYADAPRPI